MVSYVLFDEDEENEVRRAWKSIGVVTWPGMPKQYQHLLVQCDIT